MRTIAHISDLHFGREDHLLRKAQVVVTKKLSSSIRLGAGGGGDDDGDDDGGDDGGDGAPGMGNLGRMKFVSTFTFTVDGYDPAARVEIP